MQLGQAIVQIRKERGLTQEAFAKMYSVTRQTVSNWENEKSYPDLSTLVKISDEFNVSLDVLSQSRRLPLLQVVSKNKSFSVGVQSPTEINAPRGCAVILKRICQLSLTRITHQVSRAFDLNERRFSYGKRY